MIREPPKHHQHVISFKFLQVNLPCLSAALPRLSLCETINHLPSQGSQDPLLSWIKSSEQITPECKREGSSFSSVLPPCDLTAEGLMRKWCDVSSWNWIWAGAAQTPPPPPPRGQAGWGRMTSTTSVCKFSVDASMLISAGKWSNAHHISLCLFVSAALSINHSLSPPSILPPPVSPCYLSLSLSPFQVEGHIWQLTDGWCSMI